MSRTALILAAHGSRHDPTANGTVRAHADRIGRIGVFDEVGVAFHDGTPTFATALDSITAEEVTVVPVMTSDGYYCGTVLPRSLAGSERFASLRIRMTRPVGTHPIVRSLVRDRVNDLLHRYDLQPDLTSLVLVGHGTPRHHRSRDATVNLSSALRKARLCREVLAVFLDEPPFVDGVFGLVTQPNVLLLPFLIGCGHHATRDIPLRFWGASSLHPSSTLREDTRNGTSAPSMGGVHHSHALWDTHDETFPYLVRMGRRQVVCDMAVGAHPRIAEIILDLAMQHSETPGRSTTLETSP